MILQQFDGLGADPVQEVDPAVDGGKIGIERARQPLLADTLVDRPAQHVVLLYRREPVDPVIIGIGFEVPGNQAGRGIMAKLLERQHPEVSVEHQEPRLVWIRPDDR